MIAHSYRPPPLFADFVGLMWFYDESGRRYRAEDSEGHRWMFLQRARA